METDHGAVEYEVTRVERENSNESSFEWISMNFAESPHKSLSNISSIFISPKKTNHVQNDVEWFVKIKQKILNPVTEMS